MTIIPHPALLRIKKNTGTQVPEDGWNPGFPQDTVFSTFDNIPIDY